MTRTAFLLLILMLFSTITLVTSASEKRELGFSEWVDDEGNITLPTGYRATWTHLGSWAVNGTNGAIEFHEVYTEPESAEHFRENQEFPDGATLVKEVRSSDTAKLTTGQASWAEEEQIWFVMIKDRKDRFEQSPLWGDGWGWALFEAKDPSTIVTKDYYQDCISCHIPARTTDWVYVQGYPTLEWAKATATKAAMERASPTEATSHVRGEVLAGPVVEIQNLAFAPSVIKIKPGETITWVNRDDYPHTATANDGRFDTATMAPDEIAQITFDETGTFPYHCTPHPFMKATVIVEE